MTFAMGLPEVLFIVGQFLRRHDLTVCARVSRDWNAAFGPLVWQELAICTAAPWFILNNLSALYHYADSVLRLECNEIDKPYLADLYCRNLKRLTLRGYLRQHSIGVFRHRKTLTHLVLVLAGTVTDPNAEVSETMWEVIDSCESLQSLMITRAQITLTSWSACWCIYSRLRTLQLQEVDFWLPNGENDNITLSMCLLAQEEDNGGTPICSPIIELGLKDIRLPVEDQLAFLKVSPHLEAFSWTPRQRDRALIGDTLMEQAQHCPKLVHLDLDIENDALVSFLNHKVATIATHRPPEELKVVKMTEPIWGIVQVHFASSLRSLDLSSYHVEGKMILSMLTSLPNLESFSGKTICGKDVFHRQEIAVEPWVCTGLVHLSLGCAIDGEFSYGERCVAQAEIIERIGSLTRLKTLRMFGHDGINMPGCYRYLNFGLDSGLDYLKNLKQLKSIDFSHTPQQLGEREIRWMLSNWPRLEILTGTLHSRTMLNESLRTLLARHGVLQDNRSGRRAYKC